MTQSTNEFGDPIAFKMRAAATPQGAFVSGRKVVKVEARQVGHHLKEAVVTDGAEGTAWRMSSDEGAHLKGTDLAPFPLGFFNAGMQADLYGRLRALAEHQRIALDGLEIRLVNHYWLTGSFIQGTGEGHAEPPDLEITVQSGAPSAAISALVAAAIDSSPAFALLRAALTGNTFALYINGRRRSVEGVANSPAPDAGDPYRVYAAPPRPLDPKGRTDLIEKTGGKESGEPQPAPSSTNKLIRNIYGIGAPTSGGLFGVDTWLGVPGASHFRLQADESGNDTAPSGLTLLSAGISYCYMTQLARYIENMKMAIRGVRLVQYNPFIAGARAGVEPIDTHLFLNGEAPDETHLKLLTVAARTCYLHACASTPLEPIVRLIHNGTPLAQAA